MASSVIWAVQLRDPSEFSLLDAPVRPRQRAYRRMRSEYTWVVHASMLLCFYLSYLVFQDVRVGR